MAVALDLDHRFGGHGFRRLVKSMEVGKSFVGKFANTASASCGYVESRTMATDAANKIKRKIKIRKTITSRIKIKSRTFADDRK